MRIVDLSDRELLHVLEDCLDSDGWAANTLVAEAVGLKHDSPSQSVGSRMARMKALGATENNPSKPALWRPTPDGEALMTGEIAKSVNAALDKMSPGQVIMLTRWLGGRYHSMGSDSLGLFIRREFTYGTFAQRNGNGRRR